MSIIKKDEENSDKLLEYADKIIRLYKQGDKTQAINIWMDAARELRSLRGATLIMLQLLMESVNSVTELHLIINEIATLVSGGQLSTVKVGGQEIASPGGITVLQAEFDLNVGDYVYLEGLTESGRGMIERYGHWWAIISGRDATRPGHEGKHKCWYLQSIGHNRQGIKKPPGLKVPVENLWLFAKNDPNFRVKKRHLYYQEFNYKDYE